MSTVRLSFGSRAGGAAEHQQHNTNGFFSGGPYESIEALAEALKSEIQGSAESTIPECTTVELSLAFNAPIPLIRPTIGPYAEYGPNDLPPEFKNDIQNIENGSGRSKEEPVAMAGAILNIANQGQRAIVQRAASRGLIQVIEAADGFRYCFNNAWAAKDEEGSRFSYICQDSMQNKDRHANGFTRTLKHLKGEGERGPRKPTYDCKGSVSVKFSSGRQSVDVYYRHYAIHATVADRKAVPRPPTKPKTSNGPKETGGLLATLQAENVASPALPTMGRSQPSNIGRPLKRRRESGEPVLPIRNPDQPMSLMELLSQSDTANAPQPPAELTKPMLPPAKAAVAYELPSWQTPPAPLNHSGEKLPYPAPYPPPHLRNQVPYTPTPQQRSANVASKPQGLFTTMKPAKWTNRSPAQQVHGPTSSPSVVFKPPQTTTSSRFTTPNPPRAKSSCNNCRVRKLKCDESLPCGSCAKSHKTDCSYEGVSRQDAAGSWGNISQSSTATWLRESQQSQNQPMPSPASHTPSQWQPPPSPPPTANMASSKTSTHVAPVQREESPDPWFPKR